MVSSCVKAMYLSCQAGKLDAKYMVSFLGEFGIKGSGFALLGFFVEGSFGGSDG